MAVVAVLASLGLLAVWPAPPADAALAGCRADPLFLLSDGTILDVSVAIDTDVKNVDVIQYVVHGPRGTRLVAAGMAVADPSCAAGAPCPRGFAAQAIDPSTLVVSDLARYPATPPYSCTATAIPLDGEIWLSSFNGDRVAYGPIPR